MTDTPRSNVQVSIETMMIWTAIVAGGLVIAIATIRHHWDWFSIGFLLCHYANFARGI